MTDEDNIRKVKVLAPAPGQNGGVYFYVSLPREPWADDAAEAEQYSDAKVIKARPTGKRPRRKGAYDHK